MICDDCQKERECVYVPMIKDGEQTCSIFFPKIEIKDSGQRTEFATGAVRDMHDGK